MNQFELLALFDSVTSTTKESATLEILIMLFISAVLGYLLRGAYSERRNNLYDEHVCECEHTDDDFAVNGESDDYYDDEEVEEISDNIVDDGNFDDDEDESEELDDDTEVIEEEGVDEEEGKDDEASETIDDTLEELEDSDNHEQEDEGERESSSNADEIKDLDDESDIESHDSLEENDAQEDDQDSDKRQSKAESISHFGNTIIPGSFGDDLKRIEGIGPKIEEIMKKANITSFAKLSDAGTEKISEVLREAGPRFRMHDATTWPIQAQMAAEGKWEELESYQQKLSGGK